MFTFNQRFRTVRYVFPLMWLWLFNDTYQAYKVQVKRAMAFDEYTQLRAAELVDEYSFLLEHEDVKKAVWWQKDFEETLLRVHRQANEHTASDFKDSELLLQDFINRYADPTKAFPTNFEDHKPMLN